jgi:ribosomal protein L5
MYIFPVHNKNIVSQDYLLAQHLSHPHDLPLLKKVILHFHFREDQGIATAVVLHLLGGQRPTLVTKKGSVIALELSFTGKKMVGMLEKALFEIWPRLKRSPVLEIDRNGRNVRWQFDELFIFEEALPVQSSLWTPCGGTMRLVFQSPSKRATSFFCQSIGIRIKEKV